MRTRERSDVWLELGATLKGLLSADGLVLVPCTEPAGAGGCRFVQRPDGEIVLRSIEWHVMKEMRSNAGPRDSMPRDFYPSGGGGSYTRKRTKAELAAVLAMLGAVGWRWLRSHRLG